MFKKAPDMWVGGRQFSGRVNKIGAQNNSLKRESQGANPDLPRPKVKYYFTRDQILFGSIQKNRFDTQAGMCSMSLGWFECNLVFPTDYTVICRHKSLWPPIWITGFFICFLSFQFSCKVYGRVAGSFWFIVDHAHFGRREWTKGDPGYILGLREGPISPEGIYQCMIMIVWLRRGVYMAGKATGV